MSPNDADTFVERLAALGLWVSVVPLADATLQLAKWKTPSFWTNSDAAEALWDEFVGNDPERLAEFSRLIHKRGHCAPTPRDGNSAGKMSAAPTSHEGQTALTR